MAKNALTRLLDGAEHLFYLEGIRAVGVAKVLEASGVGRASFYRHFESKDDLVVAVLRRRDLAWRRWLAESVSRLARESQDRPLAVFDALAERFAQADFRGCAFINTIVETADRDAPAHAVASEHKQLVIKYLDGLLAEGGWAYHRQLAPQLALLMDGAIVTALREGSPEAATRARSMARLLLAEPDRPAADKSARMPAGRSARARR